MSTGTPLVSVVLPVRNGARFLLESLESVAAQTYMNWELVVVDDGSTDETPRILESFARHELRVRLLRNPTAQRLPAALNRGFSETRGEFLSWTSDDNAYESEALETMVRVLSSQADAGVVYSDYRIIDEYGHTVEDKRLPDAVELGYSNIIGPCFLFRRAVLAELGGYAEDLFLAEDYDFWLRAVQRFKFHHLPESLYAYRVHPAALGTARRPEVLLATERTLLRNVGALSRRMRFGAYVRLQDLARSREDSRAARTAWLGALRAAPFKTLRLAARRALKG